MTTELFLMVLAPVLIAAVLWLFKKVQDHSDQLANLKGQEAGLAEYRSTVQSRLAGIEMALNERAPAALEAKLQLIHSRISSMDDSLTDHLRGLESRLARVETKLEAR